MSDFIEELKNVKVPLWAQWLGYFRARQRRKAARKEIVHIATLTYWVWLIDVKHYTRIWYVLQETGDGKRSFTANCQDSFMRHRIKSTFVYNQVVLPWLLGGYTNQVVRAWAAKQREPAEPNE